MFRSRRYYRTPYTPTEADKALEQAFLSKDKQAILNAISKADYVSASGQGNYKPLHRAADLGDVAIVQALLNKGAARDFSKKTNDGDTPLRIAVKEKHIAVFNLLLQQGAYIGETDSSGKNLLHEVCYSYNSPYDDSSQALTDIICQKAPYLVNGRDQFGFTPLRKAFIFKNYLLAKKLLSYGGDLEALTDKDDNKTCLHLAVEKKDIGFIELVLSHGGGRYLQAKTHKNAVHGGGGEETPFMQAVRELNLEAARLLLEHGANIYDAKTINITKNRDNATTTDPEKKRSIQYTCLHLLFKKGIDPIEGTMRRRAFFEMLMPYGIKKLLSELDNLSFYALLKSAFDAHDFNFLFICLSDRLSGDEPEKKLPLSGIFQAGSDKYGIENKTLHVLFCDHMPNLPERSRNTTAHALVNGFTPLFLRLAKGAVDAGDVDLFNRLINKIHPSDLKKVINSYSVMGSSYSPYPSCGKTLLFYAIEQGSLAFVKHLLQLGADYNRSCYYPYKKSSVPSRDLYMWMGFSYGLLYLTPFAFSVFMNRPDIASYLIEATQVDLKKHAYKSAEKIEALREKNLFSITVGKNIKQISFSTLLANGIAYDKLLAKFKAAKEGKTNPETSVTVRPKVDEVLTTRQASERLVKRVESAYYVSMPLLYFAISQNNPEMFKLLLRVADKSDISRCYREKKGTDSTPDKGANQSINLTDFNLLCYAIKYDAHAIIDMLLTDYKDLLNYTDKQGITPLLYAISCGKEYASKRLISLADSVILNRQTEIGLTALSSAFYTGQYDVAYLLLKAGAKLTPPSSKALDPLMIAAKAGRVDLLATLIECGADTATHRMQIVAEACRSGSLEAVVFLIKQGFPVNPEIKKYTSLFPRTAEFTKYAQIPLYVAVRHKHYEIVKALVEAGADVDSHIIKLISASDCTLFNYFVSIGAKIPTFLSSEKISKEAAHDCFALLSAYERLLTESAKTGDEHTIQFLAENGLKFLRTPDDLTACDDDTDNAETEELTEALEETDGSSASDVDSASDIEDDLCGSDFMFDKTLGAQLLGIAAENNRMAFIKHLIKMGADPGAVYIEKKEHKQEYKQDRPPYYQRSQRTYRFRDNDGYYDDDDCYSDDDECYDDWDDGYSTRTTTHPYTLTVSPLHRAIVAGNTAAVELFIQSGANVNQTISSDGVAALQLLLNIAKHCLSEEQRQQLRLLIAAGADVNQVSKHNPMEPYEGAASYDTVPVYTAFKNDDLMTIEILLQAGAEAGHLLVKEGITHEPLMDWAIKENQEAIVNKLLAYHGCILPAHCVTQVLNDALSAVAANHYTNRFMQRDNETPLHIAVDYAHYTIALRLLSFYPELCMVKDDSGYTILELLQRSSTASSAQRQEVIDSIHRFNKNKLSNIRTNFKYHFFSNGMLKNKIEFSDIVIEHDRRCGLPGSRQAGPC